jgi:hypothetical protein
VDAGFPFKKGAPVMEHALSTALGRRCGSAAYLSDADITSSSWLYPYSYKSRYYQHNTHSSLTKEHLLNIFNKGLVF